MGSIIQWRSIQDELLSIIENNSYRHYKQKKKEVNMSIIGYLGIDHTHLTIQNTKHTKDCP